jgi:hypothetical protein
MITACKMMMAATTLLLLLGAGPALAADDVMASSYGNTVVSTGGGLESRTHYRADHTFDAVFTAAAGSLTSKGTWVVQGSQLCRTYDPVPPGLTNPVCIPVESHKIGDKWTVMMASGAREATIVAGVQ